MKLLVRLYGDLSAGQKPVDIPDNWPAEVIEVADDIEDPGDGSLIMSNMAELESYKTANKDDYDSWNDQLILPQQKNEKFDEIDANTSKLIKSGFTYKKKQFSLSLSAQSSAIGLFVIRDEDILDYPVKINTIDDLDFCELQNAAEVRDFYLALILAYRSHLDSGTTIKDSVRAAVEIDAVSLIKDAR